MNKTNTGLVAFAEKALKEKWFYGWGSFGQIATTTLVDSLVRQYSDNARWRTYMMGAVKAQTRLCDCYGLVKGYLWWTGDSSNPKYNGFQDKNTGMAYNSAKERGKLATLPEVPGVILYMPGHVGVYCGNGRFIELMGGGVGAYEGRISDGKIVKGSKFTHWFKDSNINYDGYVVISDNEKEDDDVKRYNKIEEVPEWGKETVQKLIDKGYLAGSDNGLNLTEDMIRMLVISDRAGSFDN